MALPLPSFLSEISEFARAKLAAALFTVDSAYIVTVDSPSGAQKHQEAEVAKKGALNLFFYRFEPSGFFPQGGANERWHVRARCLITAFSIDVTESGVSAGEIDLRVLGSVMQYLHEHPVMIDAARGLHLEVVPENLSSEEINQIWMSQHDVPYRPSLLYEFALLPIEPKRFALPGPPVVAGGTQSSVRATVIGEISPPPVIPESPYMEIASGDGWSPLISFKSAGGKATQTLSFAAGPVPNQQLWIAGRAGEAVTIQWEQAVKGGWGPLGAPIPKVVPAQPAGLAGIIDPQRVATANTQAVDSPTAAGTYLLYVLRGSLRSNPLMLRLTGGP